MEKLFSKEELLGITNDAELNIERYLGGLFINGEAEPTTIFTISEVSHLIFVEGNEDTGYRHFQNRHGYFSFKNYWKENDRGISKLDNPSKFHPKMIPVFDFVKIADSIFRAENKNITANHSPDVFDKYTGKYSFENEPPQFYHLLTYKDTRIVHTLFPKNGQNRKTKLKYGKGIVSTELTFPEGYNDLLVPYENNDAIIAYSILVRKFYGEKIERMFIQEHDVNGNIKMMHLIGSRSFENFEQFDHVEMLQFQHADLREFENIIQEIDNRNSKG